MHDAGAEAGKGTGNHGVVAGGQRRTLGAACGAHFVHDGLADGLYVLLPVWADALGLSYAAAGALKSAYSVSMAALQLPAGLLAEKVSERLLLAVGTVLAGLAFALTASASAYAVLIGLILATGIASAVQHPLASALISRTFPPAARRSALGVYNFSGDLGKMTVSAMIGGGIALSTWQVTTAVYGALVALTGVALLLALPRSRAAPEFVAGASIGSAAMPDPKGIGSRFGLTDAR